MQNKRALITAIVVALLGLLIYSQVREWRDFDWPTFWRQIDHVSKLHLALGVALIYLHYGLRALRWKIFLNPLKKTSWVTLVPPTVIGFTGLALLGRPGEFIRPYLIAKKAGVSVSSQIAAWTVERICDLGAFAILLLSAVFLFSDLKEVHPVKVPFPFHLHLFHDDHFFLTADIASKIIAGLAIGLVVVALLIIRYGDRFSDWFETRFGTAPDSLARKIASRIRDFGRGLHTIHDLKSLVQVAAISLAMWSLIDLAYYVVTQAFDVSALHNLSISKVLLLMFSSMVGSMVQLPAVGGGSQVATISALHGIFSVPKESAVSCGILLWLVTFMSVVPLGLALAHRAHLSLRQLSKESAEAESAETPATMETPKG